MVDMGRRTHTWSERLVAAGQPDLDGTLLERFRATLAADAEGDGGCDCWQYCWPRNPERRSLPGRS